MLKQSGNRCIGRRLNRPESKKQGCPNQNLRQCWSFFSTLTVSWWLNGFQRVRLSTRLTICQFWQHCENEFVRNRPSCGRTTRGFCTRITHLPITRYLWSGIWLINALQFSNTRRTRQTVRLFFVSEDKSCFEKDPIWVDGNGKGKNGRSPKGPHQRRLPALLRSMEKTYGKVCGEGRGVYWRGAFECKIIFIIKPFFVTSLVI